MKISLLTMLALFSIGMFASLNGHDSKGACSDPGCPVARAEAQLAKAREALPFAQKRVAGFAVVQAAAMVSLVRGAMLKQPMVAVPCASIAAIVPFLAKDDVARYNNLSRQISDLEQALS